MRILTMNQKIAGSSPAELAKEIPANLIKSKGPTVTLRPHVSSKLHEVDGHCGIGRVRLVESFCAPTPIN